ncbi:iron ABC transporter permease [Billgrantia tianxiuensis]|jgi:iron(III) transport system permease protein|uniref:Iron ABC transporter permease n=1 Tax=Billgrantia tianxiuensis TaxID=2497861 RepID=A0A6I6SU55_9GAMM|nr:MULTISPECIES: iron ABC transporter permease [Halomonas]MCE8033875.1 iron ABC transporter permease [Halomonas sp. MCCC 1A11057]QHC51427.1 iron ABC transporter permease [Halomonas tianxiuensis]
MATPASSSLRGRLPQLNGAGIILPFTAVALLLLVGLPLLYVILQAVFPGWSRGQLGGAFTLFAPTLSDPALLRLLGNTLRLGVAVVVVCALLAIPLGALRALARVPGGAAWDLIFLVPFMIPPYIAALSWMLTLQPRGYAEQLLGLNASGFLFSFSGIVLVMTLNVFPVVYFAVSRTMLSVGGRYAAAARVNGAGSWRTLWRITLPLSTPGIAASLLLVFALTIEEFGTPATLGAQAGFPVLVTGIHQRFSDWPIDIPGAAVLSLLLVLLAMVAFYLQHWLVTRRSYVSQTGKPAQAERAELGPWKWPALFFFSLVALAAVAVPILAVLATAFTATLSGGLSWENLSLRHFEALLSNRGGAVQALSTSLGLAIGAALLTGVLGALTGYLVVRTRIRGKGVLDLLSLLPNTMPGIVVAVGLILAWNQSWWPIQVYNTGAMLLLAYACLLLPYPVRYASAAFRQMSESLEAAARVCGAGFFTTFHRILLPALAPSLIVAMLLVFAIASRELVASLMVAPAGMRTVSTFVFGQFEQGSPGVGMAMSAVAIFTTTALLVALTAFSRGRLPIAD